MWHFDQAQVEKTRQRGCVSSEEKAKERRCVSLRLKGDLGGGEGEGGGDLEDNGERQGGHVLDDQGLRKKKRRKARENKGKKWKKKERRWEDTRGLTRARKCAFPSSSSTSPPRLGLGHRRLGQGISVVKVEVGARILQQRHVKVSRDLHVKEVLGVAAGEGAEDHPLGHGARLGGQGLEDKLLGGLGRDRDLVGDDLEDKRLVVLGGGRGGGLQRWRTREGDKIEEGRGSNKKKHDNWAGFEFKK